MTTVVNTPAPAESNNSMGMIIGILAVLGFGFLFFVYGMPMLRSTNEPTTIQNIVPAAPVIPQVVVPDKIDVNVQQK